MTYTPSLQWLTTATYIFIALNNFLTLLMNYLFSSAKYTQSSAEVNGNTISFVNTDKIFSHLNHQTFIK